MICLELKLANAELMNAGALVHLDTWLQGYSTVILFLFFCFLCKTKSHMPI